MSQVYVADKVDEAYATTARLLKEAGYITNNGDVLDAVHLLLQGKHLTQSGLSAVMLEGPPGTGKTYLAECFAKLHRNKDGSTAEVFRLQFTVGVGREALIHDMDLGGFLETQMQTAVAAAVAAQSGGAGLELPAISREKFIAAGVLQLALISSLHRRTLLLLDEMDKAKPYVDSMLLEFLQAGAIAHPHQTGKLLYGNPRNLIVFITKNNERQLTEPLMRRCRSIYLSWQGFDTELEIVKGMALSQLKDVKTQVDIGGMASALIRFAQKIRHPEWERKLQKVPSSPEIAQAVVDCALVPKSRRGAVAARHLFKYHEDYLDYLLANAPGSPAACDEGTLGAMLKSF